MRNDRATLTQTLIGEDHCPQARRVHERDLAQIEHDQGLGLLGPAQLVIDDLRGREVDVSAQRDHYAVVV